ncbi:MAG: RNA methyltransferase [Alphaproteobacteria bacterium]
MQRGYFGVGVESSSKLRNAGALLRTTHAFGGSFFFMLAPHISTAEVRKIDTSAGMDGLPVYDWDSPEDMALPTGCQLVGVELTEESIDLPTFRHPRRAAYILGPEKGSLSPAMQARCNYIIKIPMSFCINVAQAGAIVMYDRMISLGRFAERPVRVGAPTEELKPHIHGGRFSRKGRKARQDANEG